MNSKFSHQHNFSLVANMEEFAQINMFVWIFTFFAHLIIGCAIQHVKLVTFAIPLFKHCTVH